LALAGDDDLPVGLDRHRPAFAETTRDRRQDVAADAEARVGRPVGKQADDDHVVGQLFAPGQDDLAVRLDRDAAQGDALRAGQEPLAAAQAEAGIEFPRGGLSRRRQ